MMLDYDYEALREIGRIAVAIARDEMAKAVTPGITTKELDEIGARILKEHGAESAPIVMYDFPGATCISVNEVAAHGIPGICHSRRRYRQCRCLCRKEWLLF